MSRVVDVRVPGDKSISHRALILGALAEGTSRIRGLLDAADTRSTAGVLAALGVAVPAEWDGEMSLPGVGLGGLRTPEVHLDCGNSGTTARLLLGVLAGSTVEAVLTGDSSLRARPMRRVTEPLRRFGGQFRELGEPGRLPIRIRGTGRLDPIHVVNERASAQVKTAMLLAGLLAGVTVRVEEAPGPRDHTERLLGAMGAATRTEVGGDGCTIHLDPPGALTALDLRVPGDLSSAAFFLGLGALRGPVRVRDVGVNPTRSGVLDVLNRMGARVEVENPREEGGEPVADVMVAPGDLEGTVVLPGEVPTLLDEIPLLAALAARARGATRFDGVGELRVKETDRVAALARNLVALGVEVEEGPEHLVVHGTDAPLQGPVEAFGDHRIAMAFGVLDALPDASISVEGRTVVKVSYPTFWTELDRVNRALEEG